MTESTAISAKISDELIVARKCVMNMERRGSRGVTQFNSNPDVCTDGQFKGYSRINWINSAACKDENIVFNNLMHHFNEFNLKQAFRKLDRQKASGIDQVTKDMYARDLDQNIEDLYNTIRGGGWRPKPSRQVLIPKPQGGTRPLAIGCLEDKIVQNLAAKILEAIYEPVFNSFNYGFRYKKSAHMAVARLYREIDNRSDNCTVVEMDIEKFFNNIDHEKMMEILEGKIRDQFFLRLVKRMLRNSILGIDGNLARNDNGTPQGSPISPILANIYLHYVLDEWFSENWCDKGAMVRYADDAVFVFGSEAEATVFKQALCERLASEGKINLNEDKSGLVRFSRKNPKGNISFLGFTFYWGRTVTKRVILKVKTATRRLSLCLQNFKVWIKAIRNKLKTSKIMKLVAAKLRGHYNYFDVTFNKAKVNHFYYACLRMLYKWLNRRSQKRSYDWKGFQKYLMYHPLPTPNGKEPMTNITFELDSVLKHKLKSRMRKKRTYGSVRSAGLDPVFT